MDATLVTVAYVPGVRFNLFPLHNLMLASTITLDPAGARLFVGCGEVVRPAVEINAEPESNSDTTLWYILLGRRNNLIDYLSQSSAVY